MASSKKKPPTDPRQRLLQLVRAKEAHRALLLSKPYVIGLDVGLRVRDGKTTDEQTIKVYVSRKMDRALLAKTDMIPTTLTIEWAGGIG